MEALQQHGIQVYSIFELNRGLSDEEIISLSRNPPRVILTEDKDFGEWVFAHNVRDISVILLLYHYINIEAMASIVVNLIQEQGQALFGKFVVVTLNKIRMRTIK